MKNQPHASKANSWHFYSEIFNFSLVMEADVDVQPELPTGPGQSTSSGRRIRNWSHPVKLAKDALLAYLFLATCSLHPVI